MAAQSARRWLVSFPARSWQGQFVPVDVDQFVVRSRLLMDGLSVDVLMGSLRLTRQGAIAFALSAMDRDLRPEPQQSER